MSATLSARFENFDAFVTCFPSGSGCQVTEACRLKPALAGALEAFLAHLDRYTLADLMARNARFDALLAD